MAVEFLAPESPVLAAELDTVQLIGLSHRDVYVQAQRQVDLPGQDLAHDALAVEHRGLEIRVGRMVVEREPHGRTAVETALDGGAHRPRIEYVDRRVRAVVDARDDQPDPFFAQQVVESHLHAVHRSARKGIDFEPLFFAHLAQVERAVHRDGLAHAALRGLRGHGHHPAESARHLDGCGQSFRGVAVVVGHQYQSFVHFFSEYVDYKDSASRTQKQPYPLFLPERPAENRVCRMPCHASPTPKIRIFRAVFVRNEKTFYLCRPFGDVYQPLPLGGAVLAAGTRDCRPQGGHGSRNAAGMLGAKLQNLLQQ